MSVQEKIQDLQIVSSHIDSKDYIVELTINHDLKIQDTDSVGHVHVTPDFTHVEFLLGDDPLNPVYYAAVIYPIIPNGTSLVRISQTTPGETPRNFTAKIVSQYTHSIQSSDHA